MTSFTSRPVRRALLPVIALIAACADGGDMTGAGDGTARISLRPTFVNVTSQATAPINRIRLVARAEGTGSIIATQVVTVDPALPEWKLDFELPIDEAISIVIVVELLNVTGGVETVEWSGSVGPLLVGVGTTPPQASVSVYPGPADNLTIIAIDLTAPATMIEGDAVTLQASLLGAGVGARVFFAALNPTVATVDAGGRVRALVPGVARFIASTGRLADTISISVLPRAASVAMTPDSIVLTSFGATATFAARIVDPRGATIAGATIDYEVANPAVAVVLGAGQFRALANGRTAVTAVGPNGLRATATLIVAQRVATVEVTPATRTIELGATTPLTAIGKDANGNVMPAAAFTWSSGNAVVASVTAAGVVTGRATGSAVITASSGGVSGTATITVTQTIASVEVAPVRVEFTAAAQTARLTAIARDANGVVVPNARITWASGNAAVARVDSTGLVTAVGAGNATIMATANGHTASATVHFAAPNATLFGRVVNGASGNAIIGANVHLMRGTTLIGSATTVANGEFNFNDLLPGAYTLRATAQGFEEGSAVVDVASGDEASTTVVLNPIVPVGNGSLSGLILSGADGDELGGATVSLYLDGIMVGSAVSASNGAYSITALPAGMYTVTVSAPGYVQLNSTLTLGTNESQSRNFAIVPTAPAGQWRIVVTWGANPRDLDSYLSVPANGGSGPFVVYYGNDGSASSYPRATLDIDDTSGFGPETITVFEQFSGTYTYGINKYSGIGTLSSSGARVEVYRGDTQIATYLVPAGSGDYWTVFSFNGTSLTTINTIGNSFVGFGSFDSHAGALRAPKNPSASSIGGAIIR